MKKKMMASLLTCAMMSMTAISAEQTTITTKVPSSYNLTIPSGQDIKFGTVTTKLSPLYVTGNLAQGETIEVSVDKTAFKNERGDTIAYALNAGDKAFTGDVWNENEVGSDPKKVDLSVIIDEDTWNNAKAGNYSTTISFKAEFEGIAK